MEYKLTSIVGSGQANTFIPELIKICEEKKVTMRNKSFNIINFIQGKFSVVLSGDDIPVSYVIGWIDGYEKSHKLNHKQPEYKSKRLPSPVK